MNGVMRTAEANLETFGWYYDKPQCWFRWRYDTQVKRKTCLALVKSLKRNWANKRIFELGFGSGEVLCSFPTSCELYGAEISSSAIEKVTNRAAAKGYSHFQFFRIEDDGSIPISDGFMDLVIASHVLEHVPDDDSCVEGLHRILKLGGALIVLIPINERHHDPHHVRHYDFERCRELCERHGFRFVDGFENELLYYIVEKMYWRHDGKSWGIAANLVRLLFNLLTARYPFWLYRTCDRVIAKLTGLPPRQAALLLEKR